MRPVYGIIHGVSNDVQITDPTLLEKEEQDRLMEQFYTAVMAGNMPESTGNPQLDLLLRKGLYGPRLPQQLRSKRAAEAFQQTFELIGGIPRLALWADKNPSAFFALYSKLIPSSIQAQVRSEITINAPWMNPSRLSYRDEVIDVGPSDAGDQGKSQ